MSLTHTLQQMTRQAFRSMGGTLRQGTWVHRALPVYDPATGTVVAPAPTLYPVAVLVSQYRREEIDGVRVLATDRRLCVMQGLPTDPTPTDQVPQGLPIRPTGRDQVEVDGTLWLLVEVMQDAAGLTWQCQARAQGEG